MRGIDYTVYTFGGGEQLALVFNAIATLFKHDVYKYSFYIASVVVGFCIMIDSIKKNQPTMPIRWMFWYWLATTLILSPKVNVFISDPITKFERPVANVPYILGASAGVISGIGYHLTQGVETFFSLPDYHKYGENGSMLSSKLLKNMDKYRIRDGTLKENMSRFIEQCVVLESMMGGKYTVKDLHNSNNIWELVRDNANPINGFSYRDNGSTKIVTCKEGAKNLDKVLNQETRNIATYFGKRYMPNANKTTPDIAFENFFKQKMTDSFSFMSGVANSAEELLKQEMVINAIDDTKQSYAVAKATIQQRQWHLVTGELASNMLIGLKIVLETLAYSGFIFIAIMTMLPTGIVILGRYLQILVWLQLWAPLYAILNMVMNSVARYQSNGVLAGEGLTMMTSIGLSGLHADIEAIAAMCSASIPFISYSLLQGGVGSFMNLAGTMTSAMSGAAQGASSEITSGNLAMNSVAYGGRAQLNVGGFKHDTALSYKSGRMEMERFDGTQNFTTGAGSLGVIAGGGINSSKIGDNFTLNHAATSGLTSAINQEKSIAQNYNKSYEQHRSMAVNYSADLLSSMSRNIGHNQGWQIANSSRHADSITTAANFTQQLQENHGYTDREAAEITASLGLGGPRIGAKTSFNSIAARDNAIQHGQSLAESQGITNQIENGVSHLYEVRYNEGMGEEKRLANSLRTELSEAEKAMNQFNFHTAEANRYQESKNMAESLGIGINVDATSMFVDYVAKSKDLQGNLIGKEKGMNIVATRPAEYGMFLERFKSQEADKIAQFTGGGLTSQGKTDNDNAYASLKNQKEQEFHFEASTTRESADGIKEPIYGKFNHEQARIALGEKTPVDQEGLSASKVFNEISKNRILDGKLASDNQLIIHKDLLNNEAKKDYQTYQARDSDVKENIIDNVKQHSLQGRVKIDESKQHFAVEKSNLNNDLREAKEQTLVGKVAASIKDSIQSKSQERLKDGNEAIASLPKSEVKESESHNANLMSVFKNRAYSSANNEQSYEQGMQTSLSKKRDESFNDKENNIASSNLSTNTGETSHDPYKKAWIEEELAKEKLVGNLAKDNQLIVHKDILEDETKKAYQTHQAKGNDAKENIVDNVNQHSLQSRVKIDEGKKHMAPEKSNLNNDLQETKEQTLVSKAEASITSSIQNGFKAIMVDTPDKALARRKDHELSSGERENVALTSQFKRNAVSTTNQENNVNQGLQSLHTQGSSGGISEKENYAAMQNNISSSSISSNIEQISHDPYKKTWIEEELAKEKPKVIVKQVQVESSLNKNIEKEAAKIKKMHEDS